MSYEKLTGECCSIPMSAVKHFLSDVTEGVQDGFAQRVFSYNRASAKLTAFDAVTFEGLLYLRGCDC